MGYQHQAPAALADVPVCYHRIGLLPFRLQRPPLQGKLGVTGKDYADPDQFCDRWWLDRIYWRTFSTANEYTHTHTHTHTHIYIYVYLIQFFLFQSTYLLIIKRGRRDRSCKHITQRWLNGDEFRGCKTMECQNHDVRSCSTIGSQRNHNAINECSSLHSLVP